MEINAINPLWRLVDPLSVQQAAALVAGYDPNFVRFNSNHEVSFENEHGWTERSEVSWVTTAFTAVTNAIRAKKLSATLVYDSRAVTQHESSALLDMMESGEFFSPGYEDLCDDSEKYADGYFINKEPNWSKTTVSVAALRVWLNDSAVRPVFFFPSTTAESPDYLDPNHSRYSAKLAAAVKVWLAMEDENLLRGKGAIQAMEQWLESRYQELRLVHEKDNEKNGTKAGDINKTAIEEAAKIANWRTSGGATKTPG